MIYNINDLDQDSKDLISECLRRLPYGLKILVDGFPVNMDFDVVAFNWLRDKLADIKPVLFPIDDLTNEINFHGKNFIPLEEIAQLERGRVLLDNARVLEKASSERDLFIARYGTDKSFVGYKSTGTFIAFEDLVGIWTPYYQYQMFDLMDNYMIDYRGLIKRGLAVSVHDLAENPYKADKLNNTIKEK